MKFTLDWLKTYMSSITQLGMATGRGGDGFRYPIPIPVKKFIPIPIPKPNGYQTFVSFSSPPGNGYNLVPIPVPVLLLQY